MASDQPQLDSKTRVQFLLCEISGLVSRLEGDPSTLHTLELNYALVVGLRLGMRDPHLAAQIIELLGFEGGMLATRITEELARIASDRISLPPDWEP